MVDDPAARPSRPSVRLVALDQAVMRKLAQMTNSTRPIPAPAAARSMPESRTKEMRVDAGVSPWELAKCSAPTEKVMPMKACPTIFCHARSPRERCLEILA